MAHEFAKELAGLLGDAMLTDLLQRVEAGTATAPDLAALQAWPAAHRAEVQARVVAGLPPVPGLADAIGTLPFTAEGWHPRAALGPATVGIDCAAATVTVAGTTIVLGLLPPSGGTLALDAPPLVAGGTLMLRPGGASGSLGLRLGPAQIVGFADLDVADGTPSVVVVLGVHFTPPIQLSFGFALTAVGGVVGVNRRIDTDALRARLADGSALDALFPDDPVRGAPRLLAALGAIFPRRAGQHVVGPTFTLTWLDIGVVTVVRLDLGLMLQLPEPKIVIVGRGRVSLPAILDLRLDAVGELDPGRKVVAVDAVLVDSRALGIFRVTGSATLRMGYGDPPYVVCAVGGFYPGYRPEPASIPPQQRLSLALDVPCPLSFHVSGYLAVTSNTFQVGADISVGIDLDVISASGFLRFDAIVQFDPFHVHADYEAGWEVEVAIFSGGTTVSGWIDGPGPWTVHARVSISLLIDDFTWSDTFRIGPGGPAPDPPVAHLVDLLSPTLGAPSHLSAAEATDPHVSVRPRNAGLDGGMALASPLATLTWTQEVAPLGLPVVRAGGRRLASEQALEVTVDGAVAQPASPAEAFNWFAPGAFRDFTQAEAMTLPPFQWLRGGTRLVLQPASGATADASLQYKAFFRRDPHTWGEGILVLHIAAPALAHAMVAAQTARPEVADRTPLVAVLQETWGVTHGGDTWEEPSPTHALVSAQSGGVPHALADGAITVGLI